LINFFLKFKNKNTNSRVIDVSEIRVSNKVLFCLFTRYGDTVIDLVVIKEFIEKYPTKKYLILCPEQMLPLAETLLPNIKAINVNKRNLLQMIKVNKHLKQWKPDVGFSPWSNGIDSCFFLSYCRNYFCYKDFVKPKNVNHYDVVRYYLQLDIPNMKVEHVKEIPEINKILICPESTDKSRSLSVSEVEILIKKLKIEFNSDISFALSTFENYKPVIEENFDTLILKKNYSSTNNLIEKIIESDVVICCDSAPLHLAIALKKNVYPIFKSTNCETVINAGSKILHFDL